MKRQINIVVSLILIITGCSTIKNVEPVKNDVYIILDMDSVEMYISQKDIIQLVEKGFYKNRPDLDSVLCEINLLTQNFRVHIPLVGQSCKINREEWLVMDVASTSLESKYMQNRICVFRKKTRSWEEYYVKYEYTPFGGESVNWYFKSNKKIFYYIILSLA